jgi:hypothetical protein
MQRPGAARNGMVAEPSLLSSAATTGDHPLGKRPGVPSAHATAIHFFGPGPQPRRKGHSNPAAAEKPSRIGGLVCFESPKKSPS